MSEWNRNRKSDCPCNGCKERDAACHGKCERYLGWSGKLRERREAEFKERQSKETVSHSAIRKMWIKSRWRNQQPIRRSGNG